MTFRRSDASIGHSSQSALYVVRAAAKAERPCVRRRVGGQVPYRKAESGPPHHLLPEVCSEAACARGLLLLMEHPESADSLQHPEVKEFLKMEGVMLSVVDHCMYGLVTPSGATKEPTPEKKPTR